MKRIALMLLVLIMPLMIFSNAVLGVSKARPLYAENMLKLQLNEAAMARTDLPQGLYAEAEAFGLDELDEIMNQFGQATILRAHIRLKDAQFEREHGVDRWFLLKFKQPIDVPAAIRAFKAEKQFIDEATPEYFAYTQFVPNDPYYPNNWGHNNTAQLPAYQGGSHSGPGVGVIGFDSNAQAAWDNTQGLGSLFIVIAIIDTGVDTSHPDLRLVTGYDYGDNDSNPMDDSADPGHGTACSGIAAGRGNNSIGVAGIAAGCSVMPLKIANSAGTLGFTAIENALYHCGNNNVDVASMSFGAEGGMGPGDSPSTDTALAYAYNHGVALFAATANSNTSAIAYPSNHPNVISVGAASPSGERKSATSSDGEYWWGSNYGSTTQDANTAVDLMAPTILPATDITGTGGYSSTDYCMWFNGTSCATPYAAGTAALILSKDPSLTPAQLRATMTSTATDMTVDGGVGWDRYTGYGMVNAEAALNSLIPGMPVCDITAPAQGAVFNLGETVTVQVSATDPATRSILRVDFYLDGSPTPTYTDATSPYSWAWNTTGYSGGNHTIVATAVDNENNSVSDQVTVALIAPADEGFESGNFNAYDWVQSGTQPWTVQTAEKYSGNYAAKSGTITHNQTSTMAVILNITAPGNISFYQKTSSEATYDFLRFYIDNVEQGAWSGEVPWAMQSYAVSTGTHEFKWTYSKDGSVSNGSDCAWVDHIAFPPHTASVPATITWNPDSFSQELIANSTASQELGLGNTGNQTLDYTASLPTGTVTVLDETFATANIPTGWTQAYITGSVSWTYVSGGYSGHPSAAYDGAYNARLYNGGFTPRTTRLITPSLDLSGATAANLSFWHTQEVWSGDQDQLKVYYRTSATGTWTQIAHYTNSIVNWTQEVIALPNLSSTYYLAFEGIADYGYGVCLDKVVVTKQSGASTPWVTLNGGTTVSGSVADGDPADVLTVAFNSAGLGAGTYNSTITVTSNSVSNSTLIIPVTLAVVSPQPEISVDPTSIGFGTVLINTTDSAGFEICNAGTATLSGSITTPMGYTVSLQRGGESVRNALPSLNISPAAGDRNTLSYAVNPGLSKAFIVAFTPTAVQAYNGNLVISHNAGGGNINLALSGQGGKPSIGLSGLSFEQSLFIDETASQILTVSNSGNLPLNYSLTVAGSPSWLLVDGSATVSHTIEPGEPAQELSLDFDASGLAPGFYTATINCSSNDPANPTLTIGAELEVLSANQTPTIDLPDCFSFDMNGSLVVDFSPYVNDADFDPLTLDYGGNTNVLVGIAGLQVTFTATPDWFGSETITFTVDDGTDQSSDDVAIMVNLNYLDAPVITAISSTSQGILIQWNPVTNAAGYEIYRSSAPVGTYTLVGSTAGTLFEDTQALDKAFYQVKALTEVPAR